MTHIPSTDVGGQMGTVVDYSAAEMSMRCSWSSRMRTVRRINAVQIVHTDPPADRVVLACQQIQTPAERDSQSA
jgi:hypothetical protein